MNPVLKEINYQHSAEKGDPKGADSSLTAPKKMSSPALYSSSFSLEVSLCYQKHGRTDRKLYLLAVPLPSGLSAGSAYRNAPQSTAASRPGKGQCLLGSIPSEQLDGTATNRGRKP